MNFSPEEIQVVEGLRKREAQFSRWRWLLLALCVGMLVVGVASLILVYHFPEENDSLKLRLVAYSLPPINMVLLVGMFCLGKVISRWHGDSKTRLILKLTDDLQKHSA
jgi:hypothetical protein